MPSKALKPLYIAKSWEELSKRAEDTNQKITINSNTQGIIKSADKLYIAAKEANLARDEERCYILFFRYCKDIQNIKKSADYLKNKDYYLKMIGMLKVKEAIDFLEQLQTSLETRYSDLRESQELRAKEVAESSDKQSIDSSSSSQSTNGSKQMDSNYGYPLIDCITLVEELENNSLTRISIYDTRTRNDFNDSHIDRIKTTADLRVKNIPPELLYAGLTASKLEKSLPLGSTKDLLERRRTMSKIIILDNFSQELISGTPAYNLAEALWKWDQSACKVKNKPMLLIGGFEEWILKYPKYTSNTNYLRKANTSLSKRQLELAFNYELTQLDNESKKGNHLVNERTDTEKFKPRKQNEVSEEMMSYLKNQYNEELQSYEERLKQKDEENANLKSSLRTLLPEKPSIVQTQKRSHEDMSYPEMFFFMNESKSYVVFVVDGQRLPALKQTLSSKSRVFEDMFSENSFESKESEEPKLEIEIKGTTFDAFKTFVGYLYFEKLILNDEEDFELIREVCRLSTIYIPSYNPFEECVGNNLIERITVENLESISGIAFDYKLDALKKRVNAFTKRNFAKIVAKNKEVLFKINDSTDNSLLEVLAEFAQKNIE